MGDGVQDCCGCMHAWCSSRVSMDGGGEEWVFASFPKCSSKLRNRAFCPTTCLFTETDT